MFPYNLKIIVCELNKSYTFVFSFNIIILLVESYVAIHLKTKTMIINTNVLITSIQKKHKHVKQAIVGYQTFQINQ